MVSNPYAGYPVTGSWYDHASYSAGGIDYPLAYGTALPAPAAGTLRTSGGSGEWEAGSVGSAGRRSILELDTPAPRRIPAESTPPEGGGDMVAIVFQHQSAFGTARHYTEGETLGWSGASANGADYGGDVHLHIHGLNASGQRVDFTKFIGPTPTTATEENDVVIYEATSNSNDGLIAKGQFFIQGAAGPLRWLSALEKGSYDYWANNGIPYRRAPWSGNDIRQLVTMVGLYNLGAQSSMNGQLLIGSNPLKTVGTAY